MRARSATFLMMTSMLGLGAPLGAQTAAARATPPDATPAALVPHYAESAMLGGWSADGREEISIRVARFPARGEGTLWLSVFAGESALSAVLEDVELEHPERTAVEEREATFAVTGSGPARLACRARDSAAMVCTAEARAPAHRTRHPPLGAGTDPVRVSASFTASHRGVSVRPGRLEVFGTVDATIETPEGVRRLHLLGKWHEQTGERPRFAAAFTYFSVTGSGGSLLALRGAGGAAGFALLAGETVAVSAFDIDPLGAERRRFRVTLADGRVVEGDTAIVRETSVPIEGRRRPGATVRASTGVGPMVGHLNDWKPEP